MPGPFEPYCGTAPAPADWLDRWQLDPALWGALAVGVVALEFALRRAHGGRAPRARTRELRAGELLVALALVSPLCALSVALFSARAAQHLLLLYVAAPLLARAFHDAAGAAPTRPRGPGLVAACLAFTAVFWFWHAPRPYAATFTSDLAYWSMHLSLLLVAVTAWRRILERREESQALAPLLASAALLVQMGLLGAVLAFAPRPLYEPHLLTTLPFGLTALEDQQLGGLLMWVPGALAPLVIGLTLLGTLLRTPRSG